MSWTTGTSHTEARICELVSKGYAVLISIEGNFPHVSVTHPQHPRKNFAGATVAGAVRLAWSLVLGYS